MQHFPIRSNMPARFISPSSTLILFLYIHLQTSPKYLAAPLCLEFWSKLQTHTKSDFLSFSLKVGPFHLFSYRRDSGDADWSLLCGCVPINLFLLGLDPSIGLS